MPETVFLIIKKHRRTQMYILSIFFRVDKKNQLDVTS